MVRDGNAVGVGAQITQYMFWSLEGRLAIDHPVLTEQYSEPRCKGARVGQCSESAVKLDLALAESLLECGDELAPEPAGYSSAGCSPAGPAYASPATGDSRRKGLI